MVAAVGNVNDVFGQRVVTHLARLNAGIGIDNSGKKIIISFRCAKWNVNSKLNNENNCNTF
jgi:hypothetical protein